MSFHIRAYAPDDLATLHAIRAAAFAPVFASFRDIVGPEIATLGLATAEQEQAELLDAIAKPDSGHGIAVAEVNSAIAGFVSWKPSIAPGIGEIVGGSQREERLDRLDARLDEMGLHKADYWWYRDLRRYGTVPHAGFGLGFERAIIYATGMANIRDVIPFPRAPKTASF